MKAALYYGREDVRVEEYDNGPVGPNDVRLDVAACGICGTDLHEYRSGPKFVPEDTPHSRTGETLPVPLGHEFSGTVLEVGDSVSAYERGDRVSVHPNIPCGECLPCERGEYNRCADVTSIGIHTRNGGFAEHTVVPAAQLHRLPDGVTLEEGALVEPLAVGLHAVRRSGLSAGDTVAVFGAGPIGLTAVRAANAAGARDVIVSEPQAGRRERALDIGADATIDPTSVDPIEAITDRTGDGVAVALEFAGVEASFNAAIRSTRRGGVVTVGSISERDVSTDVNEIVTTERTVRGTFCYGFPPLAAETEFGAVLQSLANDEIDIEPFVTGRVELENIVEEGFEALESGDHVKVLVKP